MKVVDAHNYSEAHQTVRRDVAKQVVQQIVQWGFQHHTHREWTAILLEELAEFECKVVAAKEQGYEELKHVVAVATAWMIDIKLSEDGK